MGRKANIFNKNKNKLAYEIIVFIMALAITLIGIYYEKNKENINSINETTENVEASNPITPEEYQDVILEEGNNIKIHFFDVGQADSILLISNDKTMLIDAGTNDIRKRCGKEN